MLDGFLLVSFMYMRVSVKEWGTVTVLFSFPSDYESHWNSWNSVKYSNTSWEKKSHGEYTLLKK